LAARKLKSIEDEIMNSKTAFTKIDCLVILLCLLFLLAALGMIGTEGRRRAKDSYCVANLRRWCIVYQMHLNDNDGLFPVGAPSKIYYVDDRLRLCPAATKPLDEGGYHPFAGENGSYAPNAWCGYAALFATQKDSMMWKSPYQANADEIPMFLDNTGGAVPHRSDVPPTYEGQPYPGNTNVNEIWGFCLTRHSHGTQGAFCDFSVRWIGPKQMWTLPWHREWFLEDNGGGPPWPEWMENLKDF
jgi:hypothetical protein